VFELSASLRVCEFRNVAASDRSIRYSVCGSGDGELPKLSRPASALPTPNGHRRSIRSRQDPPCPFACAMAGCAESDDSSLADRNGFECQKTSAADESQNAGCRKHGFGDREPISRDAILQCHGGQICRSCRQDGQSKPTSQVAIFQLDPGSVPRAIPTDEGVFLSPDRFLSMAFTPATHKLTSATVPEAEIHLFFELRTDSSSTRYSSI